MQFRRKRQTMFLIVIKANSAKNRESSLIALHSKSFKFWLILRVFEERQLAVTGTGFFVDTCERGRVVAPIVLFRSAVVRTQSRSPRFQT